MSGLQWYSFSDSFYALVTEVRAVPGAVSFGKGLCGDGFMPVLNPLRENT